MDGPPTATRREPPVELWAREIFDETLLRLTAARLEHDRLRDSGGPLAELATARCLLEDVRLEMADALGSGAINLDGDANALVELFGYLEDPDYTFNIVTP